MERAAELVPRALGGRLDGLDGLAAVLRPQGRRHFGLGWTRGAAAVWADGHRGGSARRRRPGSPVPSPTRYGPWAAAARPCPASAPPPPRRCPSPVPRCVEPVFRRLSIQPLALRVKLL
ncbi:hypothetical protein DMB38_31870 [Streptomyces sp. WAC 06738]|nr:hypothetical protein DMB38_31870 [Streptomyces sp. WAC 06738]